MPDPGEVALKAISFIAMIFLFLGIVAWWLIRFVLHIPGKMLEMLCGARNHR